MDLPAVIRRAPDLALIDELAHTNAPGLEHEKRYEDVEDVLAAGIDVYSTVNVQHLETLNDSVCELTGVRVRETMPDAVLNAADEVVLIDLTPEALLDRLREGKIYPHERIDSALNNFFKIENLNALREVALRQVAEEVESKRLVREVVGQREDRMIDARRHPGRRREAAGAGQADAEVPAAGPAGLAIGAATWRRPRPALGEAPGSEPERRGEGPDQRHPPARIGPRGAPSDRGGRRPGPDRQGGRGGAGQHLRPDRHAVAPDRPQPVPALPGQPG